MYILFNQKRQGNAEVRPEDSGCRKSTGFEVKGLIREGSILFLFSLAFIGCAVKPVLDIMMSDEARNLVDLVENVLSPSDSGAKPANPVPESNLEPGSSTSLDPKETSSTLNLPRDYRTLISQNDQDEMAVTYEIYDILGQSDYGKKLRAFEYCRTSSWFIVNPDTREIRIASRTCKLRWCPMCAKARMRHLTSEVTSWFENVKNPKFLTLTLQHSEEPLHDQVEYLYQSFQQFRKRSLIKKKIDGGVWFFQIHKSDKDGLWHPHLHCVIDSGFIRQESLAKLWKACTLTSSIVDIRAVKDPEKMAAYVSRYAARPSILSRLSLDDRMELVWTMQGRRLVGAWGNARGISLRPKKPNDTDKWRSVGGWSLIREYLHESDIARAVVNAWRKQKPLPDDIDLRRIIEMDVNLPWETKHLEHEDIQLTFFDSWGRPPPRLDD